MASVRDATSPHATSLSALDRVRISPVSTRTFKPEWLLHFQNIAENHPLRGHFSLDLATWAIFQPDINH